MELQDIRSKLRKLGDKQKATILQGFFKTGQGGYGKGDIFIGVRVPEIRKLAEKYQDISTTDVQKLLKSPLHEERLLALIILVIKYSKGNDVVKKRIYKLYLKNTRHINNWDLVDLTAEKIVGDYLTDKSKEPLYKLAKSNSLWERRISIMATFHFIKQNNFVQTLIVAEMLLKDKEDLIHKAVGWMLREIGKRHLSTEEKFLNEHSQEMPRTMLRYAIERFPESKRQGYLKGIYADRSEDLQLTST
jgi:3-methyladenine DNA glycosylase AlkD